MIVKDLLSSCSPDSVLDIILSNFEEGKEEKRNEIREKYFGIYEDLLTQLPVLSDKILFKIPYLDDEEELIALTIFSKKEIEEKKKGMEKLEEVDPEKEYSTEEVKGILSLLPISYSFSFTPWEKILGYELDEENVKEYGKENILADILYEISFWGFSEEEMEEEEKKLKEIVSEIKEIEKKGKKEIEKFSIPASEVWKDFEINEEREEEKKKINMEIVRNAKRTYEVLKKI